MNIYLIVSKYDTHTQINYNLGKAGKLFKYHIKNSQFNFFLNVQINRKKNIVFKYKIFHEFIRELFLRE
jgi:hypothetical protein